MQTFESILKGIEGKNAEIRIKNGSVLHGKITAIDPRTMNILLDDADLATTDGYVLGHYGVIILRGDQISFLAPLS